jgi:hypothetical protein
MWGETTVPVPRSALLVTAGLLAAPFAGAMPAQAAPVTPTAAACVKVASDFNGDGYADLAAATSQHADSDDDGLNVLYGSATVFTKPQFISGGATFGAALVAAYLNNDCYADLVVGEPKAKQITVLYGSATGLTTAGSKVFKVSDVPDNDPVEHGLGFGAALSAGDFNGDGKVDVAVGAKGLDDVTVGDDDPGTDDGGAIAVFAGTTDGLTDAGARWIYQGTDGVPGDPESKDGFGWSLAAGDFNGDGKADLAIGSPREKLGDILEAGGVTVLPGSTSGLTATGYKWWDQEVSGIPGASEAGDRFGETLLAADLTADGKADLVIGTPREAIGTLAGAGGVCVLKGSTTGLTGTGSLSFNEPTPAAGNLFGLTTAVTDLTKDGYQDLAIGSPGATITTTYQTGAVTVEHGTKTGPTTTGVKHLDQASTGVPGNNEDYDSFGSALRGLPNMLIIGSAGEATGADPVDGGAFTVMTSETAGVLWAPSQLAGTKGGYSGLGVSFG